MRGQIALYLILLMAAILVFVMMTANLGQFSVEATNLANAADGAALYLGSNLATNAHQKCLQLGSGGECLTEACRRTGLLGVVLAIAAIVAVFLVPGLQFLETFLIAHLGGLMGAMGALGAVGGAIGEGIVQGSFKGAAIGAIEGFGTGMAIAGGVAAGAKIAGKLGVSALIGKIVGGGIAAASALFIKHAADQQVVKTLDQIAKGINGLPQYERVREGVLLQALEKAVDDPNRTRGPGQTTGACYFPSGASDVAAVVIDGDPFDSDGDGDRAKSISCFQYWLDRRMAALQQAVRSPDRQALIRNFVEGPLTALRNAAYNPRGRFGFLYELERSEVECPCGAAQVGPSLLPSEGTILQLLRKLYADPLTQATISPLWQPGPSHAELVDWYNADCGAESCPDPTATYDHVDSVRLKFEHFIDYANGLIWSLLRQGKLGFMSKGDWYGQLALTYDDWMKLLYDPTDGSDATFAQELQAAYEGGDGLQGMQDWSGTIEAAGEKLPGCKLAWGPYMAYGMTTRRPNPPTRPYCDWEPPFYDCTNRSKGENAGGVHLPNQDFNPEFDANAFQSCTIYGAQQGRLVGEANVVDEFVTGLKEYIEANFATHFTETPCTPLPENQLPCSVGGVECSDGGTCCSGACIDPCEGLGGPESPCNNAVACCSGNCDIPKDETVGSCVGDVPPPACGGSANPPTYVSERSTPLSEIRVVMDGDGPAIAVALRKWEGGPLPDNLEYRYTYQYACQDYRVYDGVSTPVGAPHQERYTAENRKEGIGAPDVAIPNPGSLPADYIAYGEFLNRLRALKQWVVGLGSSPKFGTIDPDTTDEFSDATGTIKAQIDATKFFVTRAVPDFYDAMLQPVRAAQVAEDGQLPNPSQIIDDPIQRGPCCRRAVDGVYRWQDSRGVHQVKVEIGPFKFAKVVRNKYGNKLFGWLKGRECNELVDYCDNLPFGDACRRNRKGWSMGQDVTWVRIERSNLTSPTWNLGLWRWFNRGIHKESHAKYNEQQVGVSRVK